MKHNEGHCYLYCAKCGYDWNVSPETFRKAGLYICMTCRKILKAQEKRIEKR